MSSRKHRVVVRVPDAPRRDVSEDELAPQRWQQCAAIDEATGNRVAAVFRVRILKDGKLGHDTFLREDFVRNHDGHSIALGPRARRVVGFENLITLEHRITVVRAFMNNVDGFPRVQTYDGRDEMVVSRILWINVPAQAVWIAQPIGPDFLTSARG